MTVAHIAADFAVGDDIDSAIVSSTHVIQAAAFGDGVVVANPVIEQRVGRSVGIGVLTIDAAANEGRVRINVAIIDVGTITEQDAATVHIFIKPCQH